MLKIQEGVNLAKYTTFKIGGPAKYFVEVSTEEALLEALQYAEDNGLKFFVLGGGSNILVSDNGFDGLIIKLKSSEKGIAPEKRESWCLLKCWVGNNLASLVNFCTSNDLAGMEWAAGIPGTIGGAVRGNAGAYGGSFGACIESVKIIEIDEKSRKMNLKTLSQEDCRFNYLDSIFKQNDNLIILSATLRLRQGSREKIQEKIQEITAKRIASLPKGFSAGSFFRNPEAVDKKVIEKLASEGSVNPDDHKTPAAWFFIKEAGLTGKKIGGAVVSEKHANFILNEDNATAEDVIILSSLIKQKIRNKFGIELREEVQLVGF